jgi:hypothetical protein
MFRRLLSLILIVSFLLFGKIAYAREDACGLRRILSSTFGLDSHAPDTKPFLAFSEWSHSDSISSLQNKFRDIHFESPRKFPTFAKSLADQDPELARILNDVDRFQLGPKNFINQTLSDSSKVLAKDVRKFSSSREDLLQKGFDEVITRVSFQDAKKANYVKFSFQPRIDSVQKIIEASKGAKSLEDAERILARAHSLTKGILGELQAFVNLPDVTHMAVKISDMPDVVLSLKNTVDQLKKKLVVDPKYWQTLQTDYPLVFTPSRLSNLRLTSKGGIETGLARVQDWILTKEWDAVCTVNGRETIVEIKNHDEVITLPEFLRTRNKKNVSSAGERLLAVERTKSMREQSLESKQFLKLIGLDKKYDFLFIGNFEPGVQTQLTKDGIKAYPTHE